MKTLYERRVLAALDVIHNNNDDDKHVCICVCVMVYGACIGMGKHPNTTILLNEKYKKKTRKNAASPMAD